MSGQSERSALHVQTAGAAIFPAIVLIHGLGSSCVTWSQQFSLLGSAWHVLAPDLPGHGRSTPAWEPSDYTPEALATALLRLLDARGIDRAHVVGHAYGGVVALALALLTPARLGALVLEAASPEAVPIALRERLRRTLAEAAPEAGLAALVTGTDRPARPPAAAAIPAAAALGALEFAGYVERLEEVTAPTLVLVGESDAAFNQRGAELLHGLIPFSRLVRLPDAGHVPHEEDPDGFHAEVSAFLREVQTTG